MSKPRTPAGLGAAGKALWSRVTDAYELVNVELSVLEQACRQADDVAALEAVIARDGLVVVGSQGQPRLAQAITELRQGRLALVRIITALLALPGDDEAPSAGTASTNAQRSAAARWRPTSRAEAAKRFAAGGV